jgi:3-oxoadipyl-CoA thiolase
VNEACIVSAVRTPIGRHGGALSTVRPDDLAAHALDAVVTRAGVDGSAVDEVVMGCANQAGEDNRDVARMAVLLAGFPETVPGVTVNRLCGSGMEAVAQAARAIIVGDADVAVGAGVESMSRAPWVVPKAQRSFATGPVQMEDTTLGWRLVNPRMEALGHTDALGITAETLAEEHAISREQQDAFAVASHRKAVAATRSGRLAAEIVPLEVDLGRKGTTTVEADEGPREDTSVEKLSALRPAFRPGGSVTAGNSSTLNDGAAAVLLTSRAWADAHGMPVLATVRAIATAGVAPRIMGIGPVPATATALTRAGIALGDIDVIELNEAFAAQALAVLRSWGVDADDERLNVNGGAIALGHPLGCSGARLVTTLVHELGRRSDAEFALATMCIGVGQGISMVLAAG